MSRADYRRIQLLTALGLLVGFFLESRLLGAAIGVALLWQALQLPYAPFSLYNERRARRADSGSTLALRPVRLVFAVTGLLTLAGSAALLSERLSDVWTLGRLATWSVVVAAILELLRGREFLYLLARRLVGPE
jgi:hypothetical protein